MFEGVTDGTAMSSEDINELTAPRLADAESRLPVSWQLACASTMAYAGLRVSATQTRGAAHGARSLRCSGGAGISLGAEVAAHTSHLQYAGQDEAAISLKSPA